MKAGMIMELKKIAEEVGKIDVFMGGTRYQTNIASKYFQVKGTFLVPLTVLIILISYEKCCNTYFIQ